MSNPDEALTGTGLPVCDARGDTADASTREAVGTAAPETRRVDLLGSASPAWEGHGRSVLQQGVAAACQSREDSLPQPFRAIAVVGIGLIGGSVALAARRRWPEMTIAGVDLPEVIGSLRAPGVFTALSDSLSLVRGTDLVVLAAPVRVILDTIDRLPGTIEADTIVTDVGSTKRAVVAAARALSPPLAFVGGHPLAGSAAAGFAAASPDLFERRPWLLTPDRAVDPDVVNRVRRFVAGIGAVPRTVDAEMHDRVMAAVSHLPQIVASVLIRVAGDLAGPDGLDLAGAGLADTTRLAASPPAIWRDICATNADRIGVAIDVLVHELSALRAALADATAIDRTFASARAWRLELDRRVMRQDCAEVRAERRAV